MTTRNLRNKLRESPLREKFDVVQSTLYLAPYVPVIRENSNAAVVLRAHNVEHEIWAAHRRQQPHAKNGTSGRITPRLKKYEIEQLSQTTCWPVSPTAMWRCSTIWACTNPPL